jgi:ribosome-associated protein
MLHVTAGLSIPLDEIVLSAVRSSGPGGQNVNKVASAVHLRFDVPASSLPEEIKKRLLDMRDRRISREGVVIIKAQRFREQEKNREDALERLATLVGRATHKPKKRLATKPGRAARARRMDAKTRRGKIKSLRAKVRPD